MKRFAAILMLLSFPINAMYRLDISDGERIVHIDDYRVALETDNEIKLLKAIQDGNKKMVQELIQAGTDVNLEYTFHDPVLTITPHFCAITFGYTDIAKLLTHTPAIRSQHPLYQVTWVGKMLEKLIDLVAYVKTGKHYD